MVDSPRFLSTCVAGLVVVAALAATAEGATTRITSAPHIRARPRSIMVNGTTTLTGTGFPANGPVHLRECGSAAWIVPEEPCDTTNEVTVMSDASGRFTTPFEVQLCPRKLPPKPPVTREKCYIGEPHLTGEDTIGLAPAVKITVTYP
jgi:hypothetical protein